MGLEFEKELFISYSFRIHSRDFLFIHFLFKYNIFIQTVTFSSFQFQKNSKFYSKWIKSLINIFLCRQFLVEKFYLGNLKLLQQEIYLATFCFAALACHLCLFFQRFKGEIPFTDLVESLAWLQNPWRYR